MQNFLWQLVKYKILYETGYKELEPMAVVIRKEAEQLNRVWQKFCQILACRDDLIGPILACELRTLLDNGPAHDHEYTRSVVAEELPDEVFETPFTNESLIGSGTIAQVYRIFSKTSDRWVALKIKHPNINEEIDMAYEQYCSISDSFWFPKNLVHSGKEFFKRIYEQADFEHEYQAGLKMKHIFEIQGPSTIFVVPQMLKWTPSILMIEYEDGEYTFNSLDLELRKHVSLIMIHIQIIGIYYGLLHSDLHWGNFSIRLHPLQIVLYDFGWVIDISDLDLDTRKHWAEVFFKRDSMAIFDLMIVHLAPEDKIKHQDAMLQIILAMDPNAYLASTMKQLFLYSQLNDLVYNQDLLAILYACIQCEPLEKIIGGLPSPIEIPQYLPYAEFNCLKNLI